MRAHLGAIGFSADGGNTVVKKLSGGEKSRLLLRLATFEAPHLVILDEPTNHLDIDSRAALIEAINDYLGAVMLVSQDRYLLEACAAAATPARGKSRSEHCTSDTPVSDTTLAESDLFTRNPARADDLLKTRAQIVGAIAAAEDEWLAASNALETA